jgi:hypothetical protein
MKHINYSHCDSDNFFPGIPDPVRDTMSWPERALWLVVALVGANALLTLILWALEA